MLSRRSRSFRPRRYRCERLQGHDHRIGFVILGRAGGASTPIRPGRRDSYQQTCRPGTGNLLGERNDLRLIALLVDGHRDIGVALGLDHTGRHAGASDSPARRSRRSPPPASSQSKCFRSSHASPTRSRHTAAPCGSEKQPDHRIVSPQPMKLHANLCVKIKRRLATREVILYRRTSEFPVRVTRPGTTVPAPSRHFLSSSVA